MNLIPHIRAAVLRQAGGGVRWQTLEAVVAAMTPPQQEALYRALTAARDEGVAEGRRDIRRNPVKYMGS